MWFANIVCIAGKLSRFVAWIYFPSNPSITTLPKNSLSSVDSVAFRTETGPLLWSCFGGVCPPAGDGCCVVTAVLSRRFENRGQCSSENVYSCMTTC